MAMEMETEVRMEVKKPPRRNKVSDGFWWRLGCGDRQGGLRSSTFSLTRCPTGRRGIPYPLSPIPYPQQ